MEPVAVLQNGQQNDVTTKEEPCYIEIEIPFHLFQYLSTENLNIQSICRVCLSTTSNVMYPLLNNKDNKILADMFRALAAVELQQEDGLPSSICEVCYTLVVQYYEFKVKCEKSDYMLRSLLKGEFITKEEPQEVPETVEETKLENPSSDDDKLEELIEAEQYLEDALSDDADENLLVIHETKKKNRNNKGNASDADSILNEILVEQKQFEKKQKTFKCNNCLKVFSSVKSYHYHVKNKHGEKLSHPCPDCKKAFSSKKDLNIHSALHTKGPVWKCNECQKEFPSRVTLRRHIQRHMDFKPHICTTCGKSFVEMYALRRHMRVHTGERVEKKHACHMCDKRFNCRAQLSAHITRHEGSLPFECPTCHKRFPSERLRTSHIRIHIDKKPFACSYCDKRFRHESTRNTHHRTHTGEKPYVCTVCGKNFIQNSNLTLHMRTHTGERPYSCSVCERKFTSGSSLKTHERIHSGERPYSCNICGKKFARMNMSVHMRLHNNDKPFACTLCPKKFINSSRLRDHCRTHTGEKPFECSYCTCSFATKSHLVKHMKSHSRPKKKRNSKKVIVVQQVPAKPPDVKNVQANEQNLISPDAPLEQVNTIDNITLDIEEVPLEVTGELILQDDNMKGELLVVDNNPNNFQINNDLCLNSANVISGDVSYGNDVNLVTVNEGGVSISASTLEGTTVKLYQLDQSLVQIHSSGGHVTISKITSKMTANF